MYLDIYNFEKLRYKTKSFENAYAQTVMDKLNIMLIKNIVYCTANIFKDTFTSTLDNK